MSGDQHLASVGQAPFLDRAYVLGCGRVHISSVCYSGMVLLLWRWGHNHHSSGWWRSGCRRCTYRQRTECLTTGHGRIARVGGTLLNLGVSLAQLAEATTVL